MVGVNLYTGKNLDLLFRLPKNWIVISNNQSVKIRLLYNKSLRMIFYFIIAMKDIEMLYFEYLEKYFSKKLKSFEEMII